MDTEFITKLFALYPGFAKVYGPYVDKDNDNREHIILYGPEGRKSGRRTISWPKAMMEVKLGRRLGLDEVVDHKDDNPANNQYSNFQILTVAGNNAKARAVLGITAEMKSFICPVCGKPFEKEARVVRHNQEAQKKAGPFCGKSCAGKYGTKAGGGGRPRTITNEDILKAKQLRNSGRMIEEIAEILCIHHTTVSKIVNGHWDRFLAAASEEV